MESLVVAVTGSRKAHELVAAFERRGAAVIHAPMLSGDHPASDADIAADTEIVLGVRPQWVVATTGIGMRLWMESAARAGLREPLVAMMRSTRCIARSAKAEGGLVAAGVPAAWTSPRETDATVADWLAGHALPGDAVAVQLHGGQPRAYDALAAAGLDLVTVMPYRTGPPTDLARARALAEALLDGGVDVLTFTSPGAVRNLAAVARDVCPDGARQLAEVTRSRTAVAAVGPVTAGACEDVGMLVRIAPARYRSMELVREVEGWVARQAWEQPAAVVLNPGRSSAVVGDSEIPLGKREYLVLAALSRRAGGVCRTEDLLVQGWGHEAPQDPGTVKHQVARLRRKLHGTPVAIETVRGVGYKLVRTS